jgi:hypothetical protein
LIAILVFEALASYGHQGAILKMPTTDVDIQIHSVVSMNSNIEKDTRGER